jgi:hypothetical protein
VTYDDSPPNILFSFAAPFRPLLTFSGFHRFHTHILPMLPIDLISSPFEWRHRNVCRDVPRRDRAQRRSEVDRRLEQLLHPESRRLRETSVDQVRRVLRLFNLCDIAPAVVVPLGNVSPNQAWQAGALQEVLQVPAPVRGQDAGAGPAGVLHIEELQDASSNGHVPTPPGSGLAAPAAGYDDVSSLSCVRKGEKAAGHMPGEERESRGRGLEV